MMKIILLENKFKIISSKYEFYLPNKQQWMKYVKKEIEKKYNNQN